MKTAWIWIASAAALLLIGAAALMWRSDIAPPAAIQERAQVPVATAPSPAASALKIEPEPAIRYPIEAASQAGPGTAANQIERRLNDLFGSKAVGSLFELQDFPRRLVATVDNLGGTQATSRLWPVKPVAGKFAVQGTDDSKTVSADNGLRYTSYVLMLENVDMNALADAYVRSYPALQQAYEDLGYPNRYFNDRFVQVIDQLLATPEPDAAVKVHLPTLGDAVRSQRPWVLYEFDEPAFQTLSSGQKLMLRIGILNERRVKAKLKEFRRLITARGPQR